MTGIISPLFPPPPTRRRFCYRVRLSLRRYQPDRSLGAGSRARRRRSDTSMIAMADRRERAMIRAALHKSAATESIGRRLGDELIAAARRVVSVASRYGVANAELRAAIAALYDLVGSENYHKPPRGR